MHTYIDIVNVSTVILVLCDCLYINVTTNTLFLYKQVSLEERKKSIFHRISTYRRGESISANQISGAKPCAGDISRRMAQWKRIEEEASKLEEVGEEDEVLKSIS